VIDTSQKKISGVHYKALMVSLISAVIFGYLIALYFQPIETVIASSHQVGTLGIYSPGPTLYLLLNSEIV
jgi:hypothetical protein